MAEGGARQGFEGVAEAVADGAPVDWRQTRQRLGDSDALRGLELLEQVAGVFRRTGSLALAAEDIEPPFTWGPLEVVERLDEGSFGVVYRAHDPGLGRDVALKLRKPSAAGDTAWLDEARRLACIRHDGVLTVHGAASHGGRDGFWSDLIDGETLAERLQREGTLGAMELVAVGTSICRGLAALHANDIVHGDVKAANVLREAGGRLVLVDLGAGGSVGGGATLSQGSPSTAAPEVLRGEAPTPAADLYGLASLLYLLATGALPTAGATWDHLTDPARADPPPLAERRPDLPAALTAAVDRGLAVDPRRRFASAGRMEQALLAAAGSEPHAGGESDPAWRRFAFAALLLAVVVITALVSYRALRRDVPGPATQWVRATLVREGVENTALGEGATVRPGDRLALSVELDRQAHVYVANEDDTGNVFTLFPLPGDGTTNPLPPGRHRLPGTVDGQAQSWVVTSAGGRERFLIAAATDPLPIAEDFVRDARAASADRAVEPTGAAGRSETLRGVGGVAPSQRVEGSRLEDLQARLRADGGSDVWLLLIQLDNP